MMAAPVVYENVPSAVTRVSAVVWDEARRGTAVPVSVLRNGGSLSVTFENDGQILLLLQRGDGSYLLDGPIDPPLETARRILDGTWRRTRTMASAARALRGGPIEWVSGDARGDRWPACWWPSDEQWICLGVPIDAEGVALSRGEAGLLAAVVSGGAAGTVRQSHWGRLLVVNDDGPGPPSRLQVTGAHPATSGPQRAGTLRPETIALPDLRVTPVSDHEVWVAGDSSPPDGWLEVRSVRSAPAYLRLDAIVGGSPTLPVQVSLSAPRAVDARVTSARGDPASGALVTVFRLLGDAPQQSRNDEPVKRVFAGETVAAADGSFSFEGLGDVDYELVGWHPQFGRGSMWLRAQEHPRDLRLEAATTVRGRVIAGGKPVGGVDVIGLPDPAAYATAPDPIMLKSGDARTGPDGSFSLALGPGAGGELRIGGGRFGVTRVPLPRVTAPIVELGDIELARPVAVTVVLDRDPGCQLRATGPIGRPGVQILYAARSGPGLFAVTLPEGGQWEFGLQCGRSERDLVPPFATVGSSPRQEVHLIVR